MFKKNTVFVVGAGASCEVGFPAGNKLRDNIATIVNVSTNPERGDILLYRQVQSALTPANNHALIAGRKIAAGIYGRNSIDEYLDWQADDRVLVGYGKAAIVRAILNEEAKAYKAHFGRGKDFNLIGFEEKWFGVIFKMLNEGLRRNDANRIFDNVRFIIFNYDRCLEYFFYLALQQMDIPETTARSICSASGTFYHAYGQISSLFEQTSVPFGHADDDNNHVALSGNIRTFSEAVQREDDIDLGQMIDEASTVIFLGFSYNSQNMELIMPKKMTKRPRAIFGTTYALPSPVSDDIRKSLQSQFGKAVVEVHSQTCGDFLNQYSRIMTQVDRRIM